MTTEERFTRIENALQAVSENQARHDSAIRDLIIVSRTLLESQHQSTSRIDELRHILGETHQEWREAHRAIDLKIAALAEADRRLGEKLDTTADNLSGLIDVVDRIVRRKDELL
jgi:hypothetical protein